MTNLQAYRKLLKERDLHTLAIKADTRELCYCEDIVECSDCALRCTSYDGCSTQAFIEWLAETYTENINWNEIPVNTLIYVRDSGTTSWCPRYYAGQLDSLGHVGTWRDGTTSETARDILSAKNKSLVQFWTHASLKGDADA